MQPLRTAFVVGALLAAAPVTVMAQASNRIERSEEEFFEEIENPCNGELVQLTGTIQVTTRRTVDANGVVHLASNSVPSIRGDAPSGEYILLSSHHVRDKFIDYQEFPENVSVKDDFHMISTGKGANFLFTLTGHRVIEADGTVKVEFRYESAKCTGG
jgi:hypothetical protein